MSATSLIATPEAVFRGSGRSAVEFRLWSAFELEGQRARAKWLNSIEGWPGDPTDTELAEAWVRPLASDAWGPTITSGEAREFVASTGRAVEGFNSAIRRAANRFRASRPLPVRLSGRYSDFQLVGLGDKRGGHGGGHQLQRLRQLSGGESAHPIREHRQEIQLLANKSAADSPDR